MEEEQGSSALDHTSQFRSMYDIDHYYATELFLFSKTTGFWDAKNEIMRGAFKGFLKIS